MARYKTANETLKQFGNEVGLGDLSTAFGSSDPKAAQIIAIANVAGEWLAGDYDWQQNISEHAFTTVQDQSEYPLPEDFGYIINQTEWVKNQSPGPMPLISAGAQWWSYLNAYEDNTLSIWAWFRQEDDLISIWPPPKAPIGGAPFEGIDISFQYQSKYWVKDSLGVRKQEITAADDVILFEPVMFSRLLKARWLSDKGFESGTAFADFERVYNNWKSKNNSRAAINIAFPTGGQRAINDWNVPYTGFGSPDDM